MGVNPGFDIPEGASAVHGIYDEDIKDKPLF
jgi:DNA polymerase III epsilon subunit-like protein